MPFTIHPDGGPCNFRRGFQFSKLYSLHKICSEDQIIFGCEMKEEYKKELLEPTVIYVKPVLELIKNLGVKAIANITGGGFYDNIPRVLPDGTAASLDKGSWKIPPIFEIIKKRARLGEEELYRTFNMGIGMAVILGRDETAKAIGRLKRSGIKAYNIGEVIKWARKEVIL